MNSKKVLLYIRTILLTTIAFWCYILICNAGFVLVDAFYFDPLSNSVPRNVSVWQPIICYLAFTPLFYDFSVCDRVAQNEYVKSIRETGSFSYKREIKGLIRNPGFAVGSAVIVIWSVIACPLFVFFFDGFGVPGDLDPILKRLIVLLIFALPAVLMYAAATVTARRRWYLSKESCNPDEAVKGIYALRLIKNTVIWIFDVLLAVYFVFIARTTFDPIRRGLGDYILKGVTLLAVLSAALFFYRRIRALIKQYLFLKKLKRFCKDNKLELKLPESPYSAVLRQDIRSFSISGGLMTFNCLLVPSVVRKIPVYFAGDNKLIRAHTFYFLKIALHTSVKTSEYVFRKLPGNLPQLSILVLSPIPKNIFIGHLGNSVPADNGSEINGAVIYSGSALCNYISRLLDNEKYKLEKKNARQNDRIL